MSQVVDQLAEITGFRDRDLLDTTLVTALRDLLRPVRVAIHRCVGDDADRRWLTRATLALRDVAAAADPLWTDLDDLPPLDAYPARLQALRQQEAVALAGPTHLAVFPLTTDREVVGVLEIESELPLDGASHRMVGSILRIYRNFQGLLDYSERDTLTGLLNRKTFDDAFYKLVVAGVAVVAVGCEASAGLVPGLDLAGAAAQASLAAEDAERRCVPVPRPHFIGVLDIDHFKRVNDSHGHLIGDEVLLLLSRLMRSVFRFDDRLYRFGGEEFVVLMRCGNKQEAGLAFERLRAVVQAFDFPQVGSITVSVGFTQIKEGDTPSSAFERADRAVYWAKGHGRNQVRNHGDLLASGELIDESKVGDVELF
jgi:diguanylate cyclase (GGDEF)-like protein